MHHLRSFGLAGLGLALSLTACGSEASTPGNEPTPEPVETPTPEQNIPFGTIEGIVRLAEGATLPAFDTNPMTTARPTAEAPTDCPPPQQSDRQPVQVAAGGGLTNLVITATGDATRWPHSGAPQTHRVRIERCRLEPRVLVAERGDTVHLENATTFPFFPDLGTGMTRALIPTDPIDVELDTGGARTVQCGFANPCGRLDIVTLYHPVHTVSNAEGTFRLTNVPAGQDVRINAWHPLFLEGQVTTRVEAGQTVRVEIVISPAVVAAPPAAEAPTNAAGATDVPSVPNPTPIPTEPLGEMIY
jgi:hypothetical protein